MADKLSLWVLFEGDKPYKRRYRRAYRHRGIAERYAREAVRDHGAKDIRVMEYRPVARKASEDGH